MLVFVEGRKPYLEKTIGIETRTNNKFNSLMAAGKDYE